MTVDEIFSGLAAHMIKGLMIHSQMMSYYDFLGLEGYGECHKYHYWMEGKNHIDLIEHYFKYHHKLIKSEKIDDPNIIPKSWFSYEQKDVDSSTIRNSVKAGMERWLEWEQSTLEYYKKMHAELLTLKEVTDMCFVEGLIKDVSEEIAEIEKYYNKHKVLDFDIEYIYETQKKEKKKYCKKIEGC